MNVLFITLVLLCLKLRTTFSINLVDGPIPPPPPDTQVLTENNVMQRSIEIMDKVYALDGMNLLITGMVRIRH